jgi:hypothetical protein
MNYAELLSSAELATCAAVGSFLMWARWSKKNQLAFWRISELLRRRFGNTLRCDVAEVTMFVAFGVFVALAIVGVENCRQAFSAGLGWTGIVAQVTPGARRSR